MLTIEANTKASCVILRSNSTPVAPVPSMCLPCAFSEVQCHLSPLFTTQSLLLFYPGDLVFNWVSVFNWQKPIETCNLFSGSCFGCFLHFYFTAHLPQYLCRGRDKRPRQGFSCWASPCGSSCLFTAAKLGRQRVGFQRQNT